MGTRAAQEGQFGDVIQPEAGSLSPSDAVNHSMRAGGGARSRPSSGGGAGGGWVLLCPLVFRSGLRDGTCSPASTLSANPSWEHPQTPPEVVPLRGARTMLTQWSASQAEVACQVCQRELRVGGAPRARPGQGSCCLLGRDSWTSSQMRGRERGLPAWEGSPPSLACAAPALR